MAALRKGLFVLLVLSFPFIALSQTNLYVDASGTDSGDCTDPSAPCGSINYAISQAATNDIINLSEGTFSAGTISTRVTLSGMGSSTIVQSLDLTAATSGSEEIVIENMSVTGGSSPGIDISTSYVAIKHVDCSGYTRNVQIDNTSAVSFINIDNCSLDDATNTALYVEMNNAGAAVNDLHVRNTTMNNSQYGFYSRMSNATNAGNYLEDVSFTNCTFNDNSKKGLYIENIQSAIFRNISVMNSAVDAAEGWNIGMDINLKWQSYSGIQIRNSRIIGCGAIGTNDINTSPDNRKPVALAIKARTDAPSYNVDPASLSNVTLDGVIIDGLVNDLRFGEIDKPDNNGIDMSSVSVSVSHCSFANDDLYAFVNEENTGTLTMSHNYWGGSAVDITNYSSATTSQSNELANEIVDAANNSFATVADALAGGLLIIQNLPAGTISGTTTVSSAFTLISPGAGHLDTESRTTFENLTVNGSDLLMASDLAVSGTLSLTDNIDVNGFNLILEGNSTGAGSINGTTESGLIFEGSADIASLLTTTTAFEKVIFSRPDATVTLGNNLYTNYLELNNGIIDASTNDVYFYGNTALHGSDDSFITGAMRAIVSGNPSGSKILFPVGSSDYRPILIEGVDQSGLEQYIGFFDEVDPTSVDPDINASLDGLISSGRWGIGTFFGNETNIDQITLTYTTDDGVSDPSTVRIAQLTSSSEWDNMGGSGASPLTSTSALDINLGNFTLAKEGASSTNFTNTGTVYVDVTLGDDSNPGTSAGAGNAKQTLASAYELVNSGGIVIIASGTYPEDWQINKPLSVIGTTPTLNSLILNADVNLASSQFIVSDVTIEENGVIQDGIDVITAGGIITLAAATWTEFLSLNKAVTINGANKGIASDSTRGAESIITGPSTANPLIFDIVSSNVTIDGVQIGTTTTNNSRVPIYSFNNTGLTIQNNVIYGTAAGIVIQQVTSGAIDINNNSINIEDLEDAVGGNLVPGNATIAMGIGGVVSTATCTLTDNFIDGASYGMLLYADNNGSDPLTIDGGTISNCVRGIEVTNDNPEGAGFAPSQVIINNATINSVANPDPDLSLPTYSSGVFLYTSENGSSTDDITVTMNNLDISGIDNSNPSNSALTLTDNQSNNSISDDILLSVYIENSHIHDIESTGILVLGHDADLTVSRTTMENIGYDPYPGLSGIHAFILSEASCYMEYCFFTSPAAQTSGTFRGFEIGGNCSLSIRQSNLNQNGNGFLAATTDIDFSLNHFNTTDESIINGLVGDNDFTPFIDSGTDTDTDQTGFQPDLSALHVTTLGVQTSGGRVQEGHDAIDASGNLTVESGSYSETLTASKALTLTPVSTPSINVISASNATLTIAGDLLLNGSGDLVSFTGSGIIDVTSGALQFGANANDPFGLESATNYIQGTATMLARTSFSPHTFLGITAYYAGSIGDLTISRTTGTNGVITGASLDESIACHWDLSYSGSDPSNAFVDVSWYSNWDNGISDQALFNDVGADWVLLDNSADNSSEPRVYSSGTLTTNFGSYTIAAASASLPVELVYFKAVAEADHVLLNWETASEINSDYFEIEKSEDGKTFIAMDRLSSHHHSSTPKNYSWKDYSIKSDLNYYRLKMVDFDGSYEYSEVAKVATIRHADIVIAPNPTQGQIKILGVNEINSIEVYNISGGLEKIYNGSNQIDLSNLTPGLYLVRLQLPNRSEIIKIEKRN